MKTLQLNFTTHEQSKMLLELGVPADSADCFYMPIRDGYNTALDSLPMILSKDYPIPDWSKGKLPCWSVGRLMEIFDLVGENAGRCISTNKTESRINNLVRLYEENITLLDFSKLEE